MRDEIAALVNGAARAREEAELPGDIVVEAFDRVQAGMAACETYPGGTPTLRGLYEIAQQLHATRPPFALGDLVAARTSDGLWVRKILVGTGPFDWKLRWEHLSDAEWHPWPRGDIVPISEHPDALSWSEFSKGER